MWQILLAVAAWSLLHSLTASTRFKRFAQSLMGRSQRSYRLLYNLFSVITFIPVLLVVRKQPGATLYQLALPWILLTSILQLAGLFVILVGLLQTGPFQFLGLRQLVGGDQAGETDLVVAGLYRWMRHPLYTGGLLFIWAAPLMTTGILALNLGLTAYILIGSHFEEMRLVDEFGEDYRLYQRQVPRLIPLPWRHA